MLKGMTQALFLSHYAFCRNMPRFKEGNFEKNVELVSKLKEMASKKGITPSQLALAWVHAQVSFCLLHPYNAAKSDARAHSNPAVSYFAKEDIEKLQYIRV